MEPAPHGQGIQRKALAPPCPGCGGLAQKNSALAAPSRDGAQERTRTFTAVKPLAPEASASTNSATWAWSGLVRIGCALVKLADCDANALYSADMLAYREFAKY